jgi:hypothetical protein
MGTSAGSVVITPVTRLPGSATSSGENIWGSSFQAGM